MQNQSSPLQFCSTGYLKVPGSDQKDANTQPTAAQPAIEAKVSSASVVAAGGAPVGASKTKGAKVDQSQANPQGQLHSKQETKASSAPFPEVAPFPEPVDPEQVLDEVVEILLHHVVMDRELAIVAALWIAMTWFIGVIEVAPIAIITAPEKACGKSQLLTIFGYLVLRPLQAANTTASFLFRAIEAWQPTILIDEADTFIRGNDELKGLVNAGHTRASAFVGRTVSAGDGHEPRMFNVWGAKAFAGISLEKHLPDATMSRGIVIGLRRKLPDETVARLRHADRAIFEKLASKLARFAQDNAEQVRNARPPLPDELSDRDQDNMEPLLAIAECAGPEWLAKATRAALTVCKGDHVVVSTSNELLADIKAVFEREKDTRIRTTDLLSALVHDDSEAPWATYNRGKPLTARQLNRMLEPYGIHSKTVRFGPHDTPKGFEIVQFKDAFARYLTLPPVSDAPEEPPSSEESHCGPVDKRPKEAF